MRGEIKSDRQTLKRVMNRRNVSREAKRREGMK